MNDRLYEKRTVRELGDELMLTRRLSWQKWGQRDEPLANTEVEVGRAPSNWS